MPNYKKIDGEKAESEVSDYLQKQGLSLVERNYFCKAGEIDLIMQDNDILVFVEVRFRKKSKYGTGVESVTKSKQQKIIRAAKYYLLEKNSFDKINCRFDVVASTHDNENKMLWIKDAFWVKW